MTWQGLKCPSIPGVSDVSRYNQLKKCYASNDAPVLGDHNFSTLGYLLNTYGYMFLKDAPTNIGL